MKILSKIQEVLILIVGCFLMSISINVFLGPHGIAPGGITGLAIVINNLFNIPVWLTNLLCNIPLFICAFKYLKGDTIKTILGIGFLTFFLKYVQFHVLTDDVLLSAIFGGISLGVALGIIFRINGSTGGTDLLALIVHHFYPTISTPKLTGMADACIVILSGLVSRNIEVSLYSAIALYLGIKVSDMLVEGMHTSATFIIISDKYEEIGTMITNELNRSATIIEGKGLYTRTEKNILLVAVSKKEIVMFKKMIKKVDPGAFVVIANNLETVGEGFKELN